jgi:hypothetical protein
VDLHLYDAKLDSVQNWTVWAALCSCTYAPHPHSTRTFDAQRVVCCCVPRPTRLQRGSRQENTCTPPCQFKKLFSNRVCHAAFPCSPLPLALPPLVETTIRPSTKTPLIRGVTSNGATLVEHARWVYAFWDSPNATLGLISTPAS